ncbi:MAG: carboxypeptidase, partial [Solirubrobacteraceae bacterium]|nr:carboxypeptidase [Solirubrobacteraceae bacterium]
MPYLGRILALCALACALAVPTAAAAQPRVKTYRVTDVRTALDRAAVAGSGAAIGEADEGSATVTATPQEVRTLRNLGYTVRVVRLQSPRRPPPGQHGSTRDFAPSDSAYHTYQEMVDEVTATAAAHPDIVKMFSIGRSYEGRELWAVKISDNVAVDESEPEVLFTANQHAREHIT